MFSNLLTIFAAGQCKDTLFLGLVPWYHFLDLNSNCDFDEAHKFIVLGSNSSVPLIILALIQDLLIIAGMAAVIFIIFSGAKLILSNGAPDEAAKARTGAINAIIGLAITLVAIPFVSFLGNAIGGNDTKLSGSLDTSSLPTSPAIASGGIVQTILQIVFGLLGGLAFLVIVIAGMRFTLSQGDPQAAAKSRSTIIYALVGLVLAVAAESIVSWVLTR